MSTRQGDVSMIKSAESPKLTSPITNLDRLTTESDIVEHAFFVRQVIGREPFTARADFSHAVNTSELLLTGATVERCARGVSSSTTLARHAKGSILIMSRVESTTVRVSAGTAEAADELLAAVSEAIPNPATSSGVRVRTWHLNPRHHEPVHRDRRIDAPLWNDIATNYPPAVAAELAGLMQLSTPDGSGKLVLWHGPPGTGKTTALRALMRAWQPWCAAQYIADPEEMLRHPSYLTDVLLGLVGPSASSIRTSTNNSSEPWRLIVAEDADEYLRASARRDTGASLGRLLNLTDGVLGQGHNALVLLTTNEPVTRLHPALTRPGRCLAHCEFTRFTASQARAWLPPECVVSANSDLTLAELLEIRGDLTRHGSRTSDRISVDLYL